MDFVRKMREGMMLMGTRYTGIDILDPAFKKQKYSLFIGI